MYYNADKPFGNHRIQDVTEEFRFRITSEKVENLIPNHKTKLANIKNVVT